MGFLRGKRGYRNTFIFPGVLEEPERTLWMAGKSWGLRLENPTFQCCSASFTSPATESPPQSGWVAAGLAPSEWACGRFQLPLSWSVISALNPPSGLWAGSEFKQQRLGCAGCTKGSCSNTRTSLEQCSLAGMKGLVQWSKLPALGFIHLINEYSLIRTSHQSQGTPNPTALTSQPRYWEKEGEVKFIPHFCKYWL